MYEDIYKYLTEKEKEQFIKDDIPKFETVSDSKIPPRTEKEIEESRKRLMKFIEKTNNIK